MNAQMISGCPPQVQEYGNGSSRDNGVIMASMTKMTAAAKLAEERFRLDIGDEMSVEDEVSKPSEQFYMQNFRMATYVRSVSVLQFTSSIQRLQPWHSSVVFP